MRIHFNGSPNPKVGVEVELQIIDPETKNLVSGASRILERVQDINRVKPELIASTVELNTDVCANIETVRCELSDRLRSLLLKGESNVQGGGGNGSLEERAGEGVGGDGGSPEGDRSARRRRGR